MQRSAVVIRHGKKRRHGFDYSALGAVPLLAGTFHAGSGKAKTLLQWPVPAGHIDELLIDFQPVFQIVNAAVRFDETE